MLPKDNGEMFLQFQLKISHNDFTFYFCGYTVNQFLVLPMLTLKISCDIRCSFQNEIFYIKFICALNSRHFRYNNFIGGIVFKQREKKKEKKTNILHVTNFIIFFQLIFLFL